MDQYYLKQAESGISDGGSAPSFQHRRHLGRGFFSSALGLVSRALPFLGRSLLNTAVNISEEFRESGENPTSVKDAIKKSAVKAIDEGLESVKMKAKKSIMGAGRRRRRGRPKKSVIIGGSKQKTSLSGGRRKRKAKKRKSVKGRKRNTKFTPYLFP